MLDSKCLSAPLAIEPRESSDSSRINARSDLVRSAELTFWWLGATTATGLVSSFCSLTSARPTTHLLKMAEEGILLRETVPADNSCLFRSILFCRSDGQIGGEQDKSEDTVKQVRELRQIVAKMIEEDPDYYQHWISEPLQTYCDSIRKDETWGGDVELQCLSRHFQQEICVVNSISCGLINYGESENFGSRILLLYDGIHYDPLAYEVGNTMTCTFSTDNDDIVDKALDVARQVHSTGQFTNIQSMVMQCATCKIFFKDVKEATKHTTLYNDHTHFVQVKKTG